MVFGFAPLVGLLALDFGCWGVLVPACCLGCLLMGVGHVEPGIWLLGLM